MRALRSTLAGLALVLAAASPALAQQTTTTTPQVPPIPVTGDGTTTTTTPGGSSRSGALADTGMSGEALVPLAFVLIAAGSALDGLARRRRLSL